jgi:hypothetical protein
MRAATLEPLPRCLGRRGQFGRSASNALDLGKAAPAGTPYHSRDALRVRGMPGTPSLRIEGAGNAGCRCTHSLAYDSKKVRKLQSLQVQTDRSEHSLRNGFNGLPRALPGDQALLTPSCTSPSAHALNTSLGVPGPHDFALRDGLARLAMLSRPPHSNPTSVTVAQRPSSGLERNGNIDRSSG